MDTNTDETNAKPEAMPELEALLREAAAVEGLAQASAQPAQPVATNTAADLEGALMMLRVMAKPAFMDWPDFETVWGDRTVKGIAESGAAIMDRHGWTMGEFFERWGPYIGLAMAAVPPSLVTYQHLKMKKARIEAEAKARAQGVPNVGPQQAAN